ncbi:MAG: response regulator transcription factor [Acidobacteria bacterium]|nr:response regulator transcription factor [Acidobacteriota bacterium]
MIRILCTDDHLIVREGIELIIRQQPDMQVVASAATGEEAIEMFRTHRPDVTIMDLQLAIMSGVEAIEAIRREDPGARVVVLTMYQGDEDVYRAMRAGASTYLFKDAIADDLIRVIREVHAGAHPVSPAVEARLAERASRPALTRRELEVLARISRGMRNREIAAEFGVTEDTIVVHVRNIFWKLNVKDRTEAAHVALRRGIIHV